MKFLINLLAKLSGASWVWNKMDGYKMYGAGALAMLAALVGLGTELAPILAAHDAAGLWAFAKGLSANESFKALLAGWATIGFAHKKDKEAAPAPAAPTAPGQ